MGEAVIRLSCKETILVCSAIIVLVLAALISPSDAQVIPLTQETVMPPWNAQQIFEPTILPQLTDPDTRDDVAPEDTPVKNRVHAGIHDARHPCGDWMFNPASDGGGIL